MSTPSDDKAGSSTQPVPVGVGVPTPFVHRPGPVEAWLSRLLTVGVLMAVTTCAVGGVMYLTGAHGATDFGTYQSQPAALSAPLAIVRGTATLEPLAIMQLGVLMLILTPVARVAFSLVLFAIKRDLLYVVISAIVLGALAFGLR